MILRTPPTKRKAEAYTVVTPGSAPTDQQLVVYQDPLPDSHDCQPEPMLCTYQCRQMVSTHLSISLLFLTFYGQLKRFSKLCQSVTLSASVYYLICIRIGCDFHRVFVLITNQQLVLRRVCCICYFSNRDMFRAPQWNNLLDFCKDRPAMLFAAYDSLLHAKQKKVSYAKVTP